jgi:hypothetical protein
MQELGGLSWVPGRHGVPAEGDKLNFAPRVGFAYSVTKNTVVRSAFGKFYSQIFSNLGGVVPYPGFTVT